jgi:hypothetical protein
VKIISWLLIIGAAAGMVFLLWRWRRKEEERKRAAEARLTSFMAQALPPTAQATPAIAQPTPADQATPRAADAGTLVQQKLLLDAASKAGEAGEPALSIQLYARLLARYPNTAFAEHARAAVEGQKKKLAKP